MRIIKCIGHLTAVAFLVLVGAAGALAELQPLRSLGPEVGKRVPPLTTIADDVAATFHKFAALE